MSWFGDAFKSKWSQIWDDGYQFGDVFRTSLMPVSAPVSKVVNDVGTSVSNYLGSEDGQNMVDELKNGITNAWYKYTGQSHLTDEVKHAEMREDTINQRTASDMISAGLSKFGINPASAGASSHASGITMLDSIAKAQQIKAQALAFKEQKYNYDVSKKLGIRTGDKNMFAPIIALAKGLFGVDVDDIPEEGILPALSNWLKGLFGGSDDGSTTGAMADAAAAAVSDSSKASVVSSPYTLVELPKVPFDPSKGIMKLGSSNKSVPTPTSEAFDLQNTALKIHHDALYDELGGYAVGQAKPLSVQSFYDKYVGELIKEGFEKSHAMGIVSSWIKKMMDDLGYTYDKNDKLWFYDH